MYFLHACLDAVLLCTCSNITSWSMRYSSHHLPTISRQLPQSPGPAGPVVLTSTFSHSGPPNAPEAFQLNNVNAGKGPILSIKLHFSGKSLTTTSLRKLTENLPLYRPVLLIQQGQISLGKPVFERSHVRSTLYTSRARLSRLVIRGDSGYHPL
jgi:hypothetical protein